MQGVSESTMSDLSSKLDADISELISNINELVRQRETLASWDDPKFLKVALECVDAINTRALTSKEILEATVVALYRREGKSYDDIGKLGISRKRAKKLTQKYFPELDVFAKHLKTLGRDKEIVRLRREKKTYKEISEELGVGIKAVINAIHRLAPELRDYYRLTCWERNEEIIRLREEGVLFGNIAEKVGLSTNRVRGIVRKERPDLAGSYGRLFRYKDPEVREKVVTLRRKKVGYNTIYDLTGVHYARIKEILKEEAPELLG